jgi:rSAM/selenodomain-associated transferase 1
MTARGAEAVRLAVLAKAPVPGAVKTRLIPALGAEGAAALHRRLVRHTLETARLAAIGPVELCCAPAAEHPFFAQCRADLGIELTVQSEGDLGNRMSAAFSRLLSAGPAILIGADCPSLTAEDLRAAAQALARGYETVLTPTEDGGYALIGLGRPAPELFADMEWSTERVMARTRERLAFLSLRWQELPMRWDVDRPADLERLRLDPAWRGADGASDAAA